ncbi:MAG: hypothetical protein AAGF56_06120, partial [Pseudomonadota bacterium]
DAVFWTILMGWKQSGREIANNAKLRKQFYTLRRFDCTLHGVAMIADIIITTLLYRYPSPDRPAYSPSRPTPDFRSSKGRSETVIGYQVHFGIQPTQGRIAVGATQTTTIGLKQCKRHRSFWRQWQFSVWQAALRATWNAALRGQALALWLQRCWVQTAQAPCLPALPLAFCATTQASTAAANNFRPFIGHNTFANRRRGTSSAAVLHARGPRPCSRKF